MFEIILGIVICVFMAKIASADEHSPMIWFGVTFILCVGAVFIPLPYLRFLIAGVVSFGLMLGYKMLVKA